MTNEEFLAQLRRLIDRVWVCRAWVTAIPSYSSKPEYMSYCRSMDGWLEAYERDYRHFQGVSSIEKNYHVHTYLGHCEGEVLSYEHKRKDLQSQAK